MRQESIPTPTFIDNCQEDSKCTKCGYEFRIGESLLDHFAGHHVEYMFKLLSAGEKALGLQNDRTPDPFDLERKELTKNGMFQAPRCKKCNHEDADYTVVSNDHRGIRLRCIYCGDISVKD